MKKTLIAIFALGSMAMAETVDLLDYTSGTIVAHLNADTMKNIAGAAFTGASQVVTLFNFSGTWQTGEDAYLGIANNGSSSGNRPTGFYNAWQKDTTIKQNQAFQNGTLDGGFFNKDTDWDNIVDIVIAYSWTTNNNTTDIYASASYVTKEGAITLNGGSLINQMYFSPTGSVYMTADTLTVNDTYVTSFSYNDEAVTSVNDIKAMSKGALVPEPATATLSLLALAGLAARRRRH